MPYVICSRCSVRSYAAPGSIVQVCPLCDAPLPSAGTRATGFCGGSSSDAELVLRHRAGDPAAFAVLHDRHVASLRRLAVRLVGHAHADDVVQDAFERLHRFVRGDARAVREDFGVGGWLHVVVRHRCVDELRRPARCHAGCEDGLAAASMGPHERAVMSERLERLGVAVRALPERQREALGGEVLLLRRDPRVTDQQAAHPPSLPLEAPSPDTSPDGSNGTHAAQR